MFPRDRLSGLLALLALTLGVVNAHPEEFTERMSGAELVRREHLAAKRHLAARSCASSINAFHAARRAKRSLAEQIPLGGLNPDGDGSRVQDVLHSSTCVTAPEIEEGPYYVNNELVRQDLREDQEGILLRLDIGLVDTATCEPIPDAFVEIWSANATGVYGSFEKASLDSPGDGGPPGGEGPGDRNPPPDGPGGRRGQKDPKGSKKSDKSDKHDRPDRPGRPDKPDRRPPGRPGGPGGPSMSTNNTYLRGGLPTSSAGTIELTTIYPGFYPGRTIHVHLMVRTEWEESPNGTLISQAGHLRHIGQMFFAEEWNDKVVSEWPYTTNTARRTLNTQDHDFQRASVDGSSAIVELEMIGEALEEGLLGFITVGIDLTADYSSRSRNYYNSTADAEDDSQIVDVNI